jgi:MFS transporter, ACS family, hexuronate transporter
VAAARKSFGLRWHVTALLFAATVINYVDRQTLSVVAPFLTKDLGLSDVQYAAVLQAFLLAYTLMYLVSGALIDRWGTRVALAVSMVWWSLANALHAAARGPWSLGIYRLLLGIGESGNFLAAEKAISEWFPPRERGIANGLVNAAAATGAVLSPPLIVFIYSQLGWRPTFVVTGAFGFVWLVFWWRWYHIPSRHPRITPEELEIIHGAPGGRPAERKVRWVELLRFRQTWGLLLPRVVADPVWWFYLFWLPKYLTDGRGFTMTEIGLVAWMPYLTADLGSLAGGWLSGRLVKSGISPVQARQRVMLPCALIMPIGVLIPVTDSSVIAVAVICAVTFAHMAWKTNLMTMTNDIYPTSIIGSVAGIVGLGSGLGGAIFTNLTGHVVQNYSYDLIFIIMAFLHPLAFLILRSLVAGPIDPGGGSAEAGAVAGSGPAFVRS